MNWGAGASIERAGALPNPHVHCCQIYKKKFIFRTQTRMYTVKITYILIISRFLHFISRISLNHENNLEFYGEVCQFHLIIAGNRTEESFFPKNDIPCREKVEAKTF